MKHVELSGLKIGRWSVLRQATSRQGVTMWACRCDCGTERVISRTNLLDRRNKVKSCGCWRRERITLANFRHGMSDSSTYGSWSSMRTRCLNPNVREFRHWGGRGITVCDQWTDFANFHEDMGDRPEGTTLDRIDVNGGYEPGNCRWADTVTQAHNKRAALKVSADDVRAIRALDAPQTVIAALFGIAQATVCAIRRRKIWGHIE